MKLTREEYTALSEKTSLPLPQFLQHAAKIVPQYGKSSCCDFYLETRALGMGLPVYLHCELTPDCNLNCRMCHVHIEKDKLKQQKILSSQQWIDILDQASDAGIYEVCLSGGEAMLHPGFWEIYGFLHMQGVKVSVFTNGLCLTETAVEKFSRMRPKMIQISVYGSCDDAYEIVTGHRVFSLVDAAIERLRSAGLPFKLAITPSRPLFDDLPELIRYVKSKKCVYRVNSILLPAREETGRDNDDTRLSDGQYCRVWEIFREIEGNPALFDESGDRLYKPEGERESAVGVPCKGGRISCCINSSGVMNACPNLPIGNADVLNLGFLKAWAVLREKSENYRMPQECAGCEYYAFCLRCPGEHYLTAGEGVRSEALCRRTKLCAERGLFDRRQPG